MHAVKLAQPLRVTAVIAGLVIGSSSPAAADPGQNATLFQLLDRYRIGYEQPDDVIRLGHQFCSALDQGVSFGREENIIVTSQPQTAPGSIDARRADRFLFASFSAYCPQHVGLVPQASLVD
jgi:Protein of unknown function (DUF732)